MVWIYNLLFITVTLFIWSTAEANYDDDKPCAARPMEGQSAVCVCNSTYCDEITRRPPVDGEYVAYTTSKAGSRFRKFSGRLQDFSKSWRNSSWTIELVPNLRYQKIQGFGSAISDAGAINWKSLPEEAQKRFIDTFFSAKGNEYNMVRVPIGGSDFSTRAYAYNEWPRNDKHLTNYTLSVEDFEYKIPMIKAAMKVATSPIQIVATTWSPPPWMKSNNDWYGYSTLKPQYYQTYADYHLKFLERYAEQGLSVWAITTTNEPLNGIVTLVVYNSKLNCLGWLPDDMGRWVVRNLGPTIRNSSFADVKILAIDDQRYAIPAWFDTMTRVHPKMVDYVDGLAIHYYGDGMTPVKILTEFHQKHSQLMILATEACEGAPTSEKEKVLLGSWQRAQNYVTNILTNLNYHVVGWIDWNIALDLQGGPTYVGNYVDSIVIVDAEKAEFMKQPMFYAVGHFSKFVPRGSHRIQVLGKKPVSFTSISDAAFVTPRGTVVVVLHNNGAKRRIGIKLDDKEALIELEALSITTVEMPYKGQIQEH